MSADAEPEQRLRRPVCPIGRVARARKISHFLVGAAAGADRVGNLTLGQPCQHRHQPLHVADADAVGDVGRALAGVAEPDEFAVDACDEGRRLRRKPLDSPSGRA